MKSFWKDILQTNITKEQSKDTGMALVLIFLLLALATKRDVYLYWAIGVHILNMIVPQIFRPAGVVWFSFAHVMGIVVSKVVLSLIFFVIVTPIGLVRKLFGADSMHLKGFKVDSKSVMHERNHTFTGKDLEQPY